MLINIGTIILANIKFYSENPHPHRDEGRGCFTRTSSPRLSPRRSYVPERVRSSGHLIR